MAYTHTHKLYNSRSVVEIVFSNLSTKHL